jgi:hypothetical protein
MSYLGHVLSEDGVKPDKSKIECVLKFPQPQTPKEIKSFLGLVGYYRRHISEFATIAKPLNNLLKKDIPFIWTKEQDVSFAKLKELA